MKHQISLSREKRGLGHPEAAALIKDAVRTALAAEGVSEPCLIGVVLTDDEGIRRVNREFRGVDRATDVLSFPFSELRPGAFGRLYPDGLNELLGPPEPEIIAKQKRTARNADRNAKDCNGDPDDSFHCCAILLIKKRPK